MIPSFFFYYLRGDLEKKKNKTSLVRHVRNQMINRTNADRDSFKKEILLHHFRLANTVKCPFAQLPKKKTESIWKEEAN